MFYINNTIINLMILVYLRLYVLVCSNILQASPRKYMSNKSFEKVYEMLCMLLNGLEKNMCIHCEVDITWDMF
jgi:hypothetical protein